MKGWQYILAGLFIGVLIAVTALSFADTQASTPPAHAPRSQS